MNRPKQIEKDRETDLQEHESEETEADFHQILLIALLLSTLENAFVQSKVFFCFLLEVLR